MKKTLIIAAGLLATSAGYGQTGSTDMTNQIGGYPACSASITDNCIQLHERSVTASASNVPVASYASLPADQAMWDPALLHADAGDLAAYTGVGGPVEERTGYPACSATVTDSCIQFHERGVTGEGN